MSKLEKIIYFVFGFITIWFVASYIDIVAHNLTTCRYAWWNMIIMLCELKGL